jgi:site-specific DNA-methyltransferase (adenine-specific)
MGNFNITAPATSAAALWQGWGTSLKPAYEPIIVAMKPLDGTYAHNALTWGVAGLWIDGGRVPSNGESVTINTWDDGSKPFGNGAGHPFTGRQETSGRWPANFIHDGSDEVLAGMPQTGVSSGGRIGNKGSALNMMGDDYQPGDPGYGDSGSAARFFYAAKASKRERDAGCEEMPEVAATERQAMCGLPDLRMNHEQARNPTRNFHPTVKPLSLMRYLCKLTRTPTGGVVLDPFMGSGSTGCAAVLEGRDFIGIELDEQYIEIARRRIDYWQCEAKKETEQLELVAAR